MGDDAVDAVGAADVLAQQADPDLRDGQRVGAVDALLGPRRGVRGLAPVADLPVADRQAGHRLTLDRRGVHHHRRVDAVEGAALEHQDLAAAALLGRRAEHLHGQPEVVGERGEREAGAGGRGGDDVVAARVADPGQGVVLGADARR